MMCHRLKVSSVTDDDDIAFLYKSIDNAVADCPVVTVTTVLRSTSCTKYVIHQNL